jgi:hypothetical protein
MTIGFEVGQMYEDDTSRLWHVRAVNCSTQPRGDKVWIVDIYDLVTDTKYSIGMLDRELAPYGISLITDINLKMYYMLTYFS